MKITKFEDIIAWRKARLFTLELHRSFEENKDFAFLNQLFRAVVSITNNIAEGFDRQTDKEFKQFLYISKGSASEVKSMLYLALDFKYITQKRFDTLKLQLEEVIKALTGLIKSV